ncbi:glycosyltransferase family A protein [Salinibaculum marinum]
MLKRAVRSIERQTYSPMELIVIGSPKTPNIGEFVTNASVEQTQYLDADASSPSAARNLGIKNANGEYLAFLDDDDEWLPSKTKEQLSRISETGTGVCHVGVKKIGPNGINSISQPQTEGDVTKKLLENTGVYGTLSAMMVHRDLATKVGGFDEHLTLCEDGDFNIRLSLHTEFSTISEALVNKYTGGHEQITDSIDIFYKDKEQMINKHRGLAQKFGEKTERKFLTKYMRGEGRRAANLGQYSKARQAYLQALLEDPLQLQNWFWLLLVIAGPVSFKSARYVKRKVVRIVFE